MGWWSTTVDFLTGKNDVSFQNVLDSVNWKGVGTVAGTYFLTRNAGSGSSAPSSMGYQGGIPRYSAVRQPVADTYDPNRRPGSGGRRYFTDTQFVDPYASIETAVANDVAGDAADAAADAAAETPVGTAAVSQDPSEGGLATLDIVRQLASRQADLLREQNLSNPANQLQPTPLQFAPPPTGNTSPIMSRAPAQVIQDMPIPQQTQGLQGFVPQYAAGGIANLAQGRYLNGPTDGMADRVPANIDGQQEARLSDGEFVIPADVVSHIGNGNSNAGAEQLYAMMDRIRKARTGNPDQGKQINAAQYLPKTR